MRITHDQFPVVIHDQLVQVSMTKAGIGIALVPEEVAAKEPELIRVIPDAKPLVAENWLVTHRELHMSRRVRFVHDFLAEQLTGE